MNGCSIGASPSWRKVAAVALRAASAALLGVALFGGGADAQPRATRVLVADVQEREIRDEAPLIGSLVATIDSPVATRVAGVVLETTFQVGDIVKENAVIARIDPRSYEIERDAAQAALLQAEAGVAVAEARRRRADDELRRAEGLRGSAAYSTARVEDLGHAAVEAASAEAQAVAQLASAKAALDRAEYFLRWVDIRAPFSGVVSERLAQPGQYIAIGQAAARVVNLEELEVEIDAPVDRIGALAVGEKVRVVIGAASAEGTVRAVIPREAVATRTRPVRISVDLADFDTTLLAPGSVVTVMAPTSTPRVAIVAPKDALVQARGGWMVFVAAEDKALPRPVVIGAAVGDAVEIREGLALGEKVVVRGNEGLRPNQPIAPAPFERETSRKDDGT